jgi:hypothetical protein
MVVEVLMANPWPELIENPSYISCWTLIQLYGTWDEIIAYGSMKNEVEAKLYAFNIAIRELTKGKEVIEAWKAKSSAEQTTATKQP